VAAAQQRTETGTRDLHQVSGRLPSGQQVGGALGQHDRNVDARQPGRHIEQNSVPQQAPEIDAGRQTIPQTDHLGLSGSPRRGPQPRE
jgi:hypothetical protein